MEKGFKVAAVSAEGLDQPFEKHLATLEQVLPSLARQGVRLALFPEGFLTGYSDGGWGNDFARSRALRLDSPDVGQALELVRKSGLYVSMGLWEDVGYPVMSQILAGPSGVLGHYQKVHPAEGHGARGTNLQVVDLGFCRTGTMICKDMGFPESARTLVLRGANVILHSIAAGFEKSRTQSTSAHTNAVKGLGLACLRAKENHTFLVQANWSGSFRNARDGKGLTRRVRVTKGVNRLLVKCANIDGSCWGFIAFLVYEKRRTSPDGRSQTTP